MIDFFPNIQIICRHNIVSLFFSFGSFGGKGYPLLEGFIQENDVFVYFSDEMGENI